MEKHMKQDIGPRDVDSVESKEEAFLVENFHMGCRLYRVESDSFKLNNFPGVKWLFKGVLPTGRADKPWMSSYLALVPEDLGDLDFTCNLLEESGIGDKEVTIYPAEKLQANWEHLAMFANKTNGLINYS
jgi:hypothetical protein